jgi:hypothetical protein
MSDTIPVAKMFANALGRDAEKERMQNGASFLPSFEQLTTSGLSFGEIQTAVCFSLRPGECVFSLSLTDTKYLFPSVAKNFGAPQRLPGHSLLDWPCQLNLHLPCHHRPSVHLTVGPAETRTIFLESQ